MFGVRLHNDLCALAAAPAGGRGSYVGMVLVITLTPRGPTGGHERLVMTMTGLLTK
jgi:hypothetical protein